MINTPHPRTAVLLFLLAATTAGCAGPSVREADRLAQAGQWEEAKAADQHHAQGKQLLAQNNVLGALREFKIALGFDPSRRLHQTAGGDATQVILRAIRFRQGKNCRPSVGLRRR